MNKRLLLLLIPFLLSSAASGQEDDFGFEDEEAIELPLSTVWAIDFTSEFQVDFLYVSEDNFEFGKFNGLDEKGAYLVGSWNVISRPSQEDDQDTSYWTLSSDNLGLSTANFEFAAGKQGNYNFTVEFSNIRTVGNDTGVTPFRGSEVLTLPSTWVAARSTAGMTATETFTQFEPELERSSLTVAFNKLLGNNWLVDASYRYEIKNGKKLIGAAFYIDAANPHAALIPEPVDYTTSEVDLEVEYNGKELQLGLSYHLSNFDNEANEDHGLTWQNPYSGAFGADVDYPNGFAAIALPPDHRFQQLRARGTYRFTPKIRVQIDATLGTSQYRDTLLPYTTNPELALHTALPVSKLADLDTSTLNITVLTNPMRRLSLNFKYRYEERDNTMDRFPWLYVRGDAQNQPSAIRAVFNNPQHIIKEKFTSEATWRMRNRTRFTLTYDFEEVTRSLVSVEKTEEDRFSGIVKLYPLDRLAIRFEAAYADRAASTYQWAESFLNRFTVEQINRIPDNRRWTNHPLLRQDYLANRESNFFKLRVTYLPLDSLNLALDGDYRYHDYDESVLGLKSSSQTSVNFHANYTAIEHVDLYGWLNYGLFETDQSGRSFRGGIEQPANEIFTPLAQGSDPGRDWDVEEAAQTYGFGGGVNWMIMQDKFDISADYVYTRTSTEYEFSTHGAADLLGVPLPDHASMLHQFILNANYHVGSNMTWRMSYQYYRFRPLQETGTSITGQTFLVDDDWALDGLNPDTLTKVLSLGRSSANEVINMISVSMTYRY